MQNPFKKPNVLPVHNIWVKFDNGTFVTAQTQMDPWGELYCWLYDSPNINFYLKLNSDGSITSKYQLHANSWRYVDVVQKKNGYSFPFFTK